MLYDKDIREPLFEFLEETYGKVRFLEEQVMGQSRADIVMVVPDALYGIEIKSDADSYVRLERQIQDYDLYYDYNYVVVGTKHGANISITNSSAGFSNYNAGMIDCSRLNIDVR